MKATMFRTVAAALGIIVLGAVFTLSASAECGGLQQLKPGASLQPQSWQGQNDFGAASLLLASDNDSDDAIVGMWHVTFTAKGNTGPEAPPDGAPIDSALVVWHSDKTEIMNSGRPPQDGDFCMGVWEKTGRSRYKLNHFAWGGNDTTNAPSGIGNPAGPTRIVENVLLGPDANYYVGTFTLDAYDTSGNITAHIIGVLTATRITVNTTVKGLL